MTKSQKISLWIGVAIPVLMILAITLAVYIPRIAVKPTDDFIYTNYDRYEYNRTVWYQVEDGKIVLKEKRLKDSYINTYDRYDEYTNGVKDSGGEVIVPPQIYRYNAETDESVELTLEEARELTLQDSDKSQNGFEVRRGTNTDDFFPLYYDYNNRDDLYLIKGTYSKKINPIIPEKSLSSSYYYNDSTRFFEVLGWVIEE